MAGLASAGLVRLVRIEVGTGFWRPDPRPLPPPPPPPPLLLLLLLLLLLGGFKDDADDIEVGRARPEVDVLPWNRGVDIVVVVVVAAGAATGFPGVDERGTCSMDRCGGRNPDDDNAEDDGGTSIEVGRGLAGVGADAGVGVDVGVGLVVGSLDGPRGIPVEGLPPMAVGGVAVRVAVAVAGCE